MLGSYGAEKLRNEELMRAREALSLLKERKAKGLNSGQIVGASIVGATLGSYSYRKPTNEEPTHKPQNSHHRRVLNSEEEIKVRKDTPEYTLVDNIPYDRYGLLKSNLRYDSITDYKVQNYPFNPNLRMIPLISMHKLEKHDVKAGAYRHQFMNNFKSDIKHVKEISNSHDLETKYKPQSNLANLGKNILDSNNKSNAKNEVIKPPLSPAINNKYEASATARDHTIHYEDKKIDNNIKKDVNDYESGGDEGKCQYCRRSFNLDSLVRHSKVCQSRPDKKKRKVFDSQKKRIVDDEQKNLQKKETNQSSKKVSKWKLQSAQLRKAIRSTKEENDNKEESLYTPCPTCGRSFSEVAAKRHIPFCASRAKANLMKNRVQRKNY